MQLHEKHEQISNERILRIKELDEVNEQMRQCQAELARCKENFERTSAQLEEYRKNGKIPDKEEVAKSENIGGMKNLLQEKMESALMKQIKDLEHKLAAANHAAATGKRFDDFDEFAF